MNRAFEKELSRALATELDTAAPKTLLRLSLIHISEPTRH